MITLGELNLNSVNWHVSSLRSYPSPEKGPRGNISQNTLTGFGTRRHFCELLKDSAVFSVMVITIDRQKEHVDSVL